MLGISSYYSKRLFTFFIIYLLYELIEVSLLELTGSGTGELTGITDIIIFVGGTLAAFCFCILPYLIYLAALPAAFHGCTADRVVSQVLFAVFCLINGLEELAEVLSGDSFRLVSSELIRTPSVAWNHFLHFPYFGAGIVVTLTVVVLSFLLFRRYLHANRADIPSGVHRTVVALAVAGVGFLLMFATHGIEQEQPVSEIFRDGFISLFGGIFAMTRMPDLTLIFAPPCLGVLILLSLLLLIGTVCRRMGAEKYAPLALVQQPWQSLCARFGAFNVWLVSMLIFVLSLRLITLGLYPLMDTTEARYAEMARKMVETGHWLQPQFDYGVPFWGKPPLSFWATAVGMSIFGVNEFGARIAPFICMLTVGLCFLAWPFRVRRFPCAIACMVVLFTSGIGFVAAGAVMTDAFLTLGITLALVSFRRLMQTESRHTLSRYTLFVGLAIGLLSKGPLTLILTGVPIFLWLLASRRWASAWQRVPWIKGTLLMLLLVLPWYIAAECATPGFLRYFLIGEHIERFLVPGWQGDLYGSGHARSFGTIWLYAAEMFLPWVLLIPFLLRRRSTTPQPASSDKWGIYLLAWGLTPLVFFTPARNILPAYVLPALPAWCILLVELLRKRDDARLQWRLLLLSPAPLLLIAVLFVIGSGFRFIDYRCDKELMGHCEGGQPVYYQAQPATYSARFYTQGHARTLSVSPDSLPIGTYIVTHADTPPPGNDWTVKARNYRHTLLQKQPR